MLTEIIDKTELETGIGKLSNDIARLNIVSTTLINNLKNIPSYEDIDATTPGNTLANNITNISKDLEISSKNISNYVNSLLVIDQEENIEESNLYQSSNDIPTVVPASPYVEEYSNSNQSNQMLTSVPQSNNSNTKEQTYTYTNPQYNDSPPTTQVKTIEPNPAPITGSSNPEPAPQQPQTTPAVNTGGPVDISKYNNRPEAGFVVTQGNATYSLNDSDFDLLCSIVAAESDKSYDDALAVVTTILNRCEASNWVASFGSNPIAQATAPNQFVVYQHGSYKQFTNGNAPDTVKTAVRDALAGVRNHSYLSFRSNGSKGYSNNLITATGNRYK